MLGVNSEYIEDEKLSKANPVAMKSQILKPNSKKVDERTAIDLFSGCGGLTYGLKKANFQVIAALEQNPIAASSYRLNHPGTSLKEADIRKINGKAWLKELCLRPGDLDLLAGCPPCQGFSRLRTKNGAHSNNDSRNRLILDMARLIEAFLPKAVMLENVPGLEGKSVFKEFLRVLKRNGYMPTWAVHDVQNYGVPQRRRRLVLVAGQGFGISFGSKSKAIKTVRSAIGHLKPAGTSGDPLHDIQENRTQRMREWISLIPKDGGGRLDLPLKMQRPCHLRSNGFKDVYGRMAWDDVSPTITGGCFNPSKGRFLHPEEDRNISIREAALLQTFPRSFRLPKGTTKTDAALMIGNALPPEFVRRQALAIRKAIENE